MVPPWCIINWLIVYMATALARSLSSSLPSRSPNRVCYGGDLLRIYSSTHLARIIQATVPPPLSPPRQPPASPRLRQRPLRLPGSPPHCGGAARLAVARARRRPDACLYTRHSHLPHSDAPSTRRRHASRIMHDKVSQGPVCSRTDPLRSPQGRRYCRSPATCRETWHSPAKFCSRSCN